jgi:succinate dehydrogenase / fumarate reductase membrane anchor subunit
VAAISAGRRVKPSGGFELTAWYFMRISGLVLVLLALGHLFVVHIVFNVESINYAFVADRWTSPRMGWFWRLWDLAMINLAVLHGCNGLRQVLDEYIIRPGKRVVAHTLLWVVMAILMGMGNYAIVMFVPDRDYIQAHPMKSPTAAQITVSTQNP